MGRIEGVLLYKTTPRLQDSDEQRGGVFASRLAALVFKALGTSDGRKTMASNQSKSTEPYWFCRLGGGGMKDFDWAGETVEVTSGGTKLKIRCGVRRGNPA